MADHDDDALAEAVAYAFPNDTSDEALAEAVAYARAHPVLNERGRLDPAATAHAARQSAVGHSIATHPAAKRGAAPALRVDLDKLTPAQRMNVERGLYKAPPAASAPRSDFAHLTPAEQMTRHREQEAERQARDRAKRERE